MGECSDVAMKLSAVRERGGTRLAGRADDLGVVVREMPPSVAAVLLESIDLDEAPIIDLLSKEVEPPVRDRADRDRSERQTRLGRSSFDLLMLMVIIK